MRLAMKANKFAAYAWVVLAFNVLVILWGAVVRATGSGAGCGSHWPLCNGEVIPQTQAVATFIEFFHRATSGIALLLVVGMFVYAVRAFPKGHPARTSALLSVILIVIESLIGAFIVVQELTANNSSIARAVIIAIHQANTLLLLGAITLTIWWATGGAVLRSGVSNGERTLRIAMAIGVVGLIALSATGAITALGDTLFPAASLEAGWQAKFLPTAHFLEQLRIVHPAVAGAMGIYVLIVGWRVAHRTRDALTQRLASTLTGLFFAQGALGIINVLALAPVWIQLAHLLLADAVWITFVFLAASIFAPQANAQAVPTIVPSCQPVFSTK